MAYTIAGIDVHKRMLRVVVRDGEKGDEEQFEGRQFASNPASLRQWADWLLERQVEEVVMESTAQYWKPVGGLWNGTGSRPRKSGWKAVPHRELCI